MEFDFSEYTEVPDINYNQILNQYCRKKRQNKYNIKYDTRTMIRYRLLRKHKLDPFFEDELEGKQSFEFKYMWDPYTGDRLEEDPYGSLYFNPIHLVKYYYTHRLDHLWVEPKDDVDGYYEGYYDDGCGIGEEFEVKGRGNYIEWYLFRLPIIDCYLTTRNNQIITFGPKLTKDEIIEINTKCQNNKDEYQKLYGEYPPDLVKIYELYHKAIANHKDLIDTTKDTIEEQELMYSIMNKEAIIALRTL